MEKKENQLIPFLYQFIFLLLFLFAASPAAGANAELQRFVQTFHNLSISDANSAIEVWGSLDTREKWQEHAGVVLGDPLRSRTFFVPAVFFPKPAPKHLCFVACYNPWFNALLTLKVERNNGALQITDFDLIMPERTSALSGLAADQLSAVLSERVRKAQKAFIKTQDTWMGKNITNDRSNEWRWLKENLNYTISEIRSALSWEGDPAKKALRTSFAQVVSALKSKEGGNEVGLGLSQTQPTQWRNTLNPVLVDESGDFPVIVLAAKAHPLLYLWLKIHPGSKKPVIKEHVLDIGSSAAIY